MPKKLLVGIIAAAVIIILIFIVFFTQKGEGTKEEEQQEPVVTPEELDESIIKTIEELKPICADFLAGDINSEADCAGFDKLVNQDLCYYCFAAKNSDASLCGKISEYSGFRLVCEKITGSSIEEIIGK